MTTPSSIQFISKLGQGRRFFKEIYNHKPYIKLDDPQITTKHIIQALGIVELNRLLEPHFYEMWINSAYVFEI